MEDNILTTAKEITLAVMAKVSIGGDTSPESVGDKAGKLFKTVLKQVVEGINENKPEPKAPSTSYNNR